MLYITNSYFYKHVIICREFGGKETQKTGNHDCPIEENWGLEYPNDRLTFHFLSFFLKLINLFLWLCWVFFSVQGLSLVVASGGHSSSRCTGLSLLRPLLLQSTGSRRADSVIVAHGPSCSVACGIFPDQGSNPCPLHWQSDCQPLRHQGSPSFYFLSSD